MKEVFKNLEKYMVNKVVFTGKNEIIKENENVIFLGHWCFKNKIFKNLSEDTYKVIESDCFSKNELEKQYEVLKNYYEIILDELYPQLNKIHNLKWCKRSWRILIGPWLFRYVLVFGNRYYILKKAEKFEKDLFKNIHHDYVYENNVTLDLNDFTVKASEDNFNNDIFNRILEVSKIKENNFKPRLPQKLPLNNKSNITSNKNKILKTVNVILFRFLDKLFNQKCIFYQTYINDFFTNLKIIISLKQLHIPYALFLNEEKINLDIDTNLRRQIKFRNESDELLSILKKIINEVVPKYYLEHFNFFLQNSNNSILPRSKKIILTANAVFRDTIFKIWTADQINKGSKLICRQHGGDYGINKPISHMDHEIDISDKFISWGWDDKNSSKVIKGPGMIINKKNIKKITEPKILLVSQCTSRYVHQDLSTLFSYRSQIYKKKVFNFLSNVDPKLLEIFYLRNKKILEDDNRQEDISYFTNELLNSFPKIRVSDKKLDIKSDFNSSELVIFFFMQTSFLESLAYNRPTVNVFSCEDFLITEKVKPYYDDLKKNKIIFESPFEASKFISENYRNLNDWWKDEKTQKSKKNFLSSFFNQDNDNYKKIYNVVRDLL